MQLNWIVDYSQNKLTLNIENHRYETVDGGQNIFKYTDNVFVKRIRQFPEMPDDWVQPHMDSPKITTGDEWPDEVDWLVENYTHIVGEKYLVKTYREKDGSITNENFVRGAGVNNLTDLISVNRLGQPASVQERWDWIELALASIDNMPDNIHTIDPNITNAPYGLVWGKHKETHVIHRYGSTQHCPCHVFPKIYVPVIISEENLLADVQKYNGHMSGNI